MKKKPIKAVARDPKRTPSAAARGKSRSTHAGSAVPAPDEQANEGRPLQYKSPIIHTPEPKTPKQPRPAPTNVPTKLPVLRQRASSAMEQKSRSTPEEADTRQRGGSARKRTR
jgi:hypothetical protein